MSNETDSRREASEHDEKPKLKVTDRRMFDIHGNPRQPEEDRTEASSDTPSPAAEAAIEETPAVDAGPEQATADEDSSPSPAAEQPSPPPAAEATDPAPAAEDTAPPPASQDDPAASGNYADLPRGFAPFIESQYLEALIFLGAVPHPQTGETMQDPEFARYKIDLLTMIQEKTEGNLNAEEKKLIEDVLYQLRMLFVQKTGPAAP